MDTEREEIPINTNPDMDNPLLDEAPEANILDDAPTNLGEDMEVSSELSEDLGSLNELPGRDEIETSYDIGDLIIVLLKDKGKPFLGKGRRRSGACCARRGATAPAGRVWRRWRWRARCVWDRKKGRGVLKWGKF